MEKMVLQNQIQLHIFIQIFEMDLTGVKSECVGPWQWLSSTPHRREFFKTKSVNFECWNHNIHNRFILFKYRGLTRNTYFRCRVDFRDAPSSNSFVRLTVIVQPRQVAIFDEAGTERNTFVGPYLEGDSMNVFCQAIGGGSTTAYLHAIRIGRNMVAESHCVNCLFLARKREWNG